MKDKAKVFVLLLLLSLMSTRAYALEVFEGKVAVVESSYLPVSVAFTMYVGNATCPTGTWLWWENSSAPDQVKGVYATLMTAMVTGKRVRFHFNDGDTTCRGKHLHLLDN